jgi:hypothetical protein
MENNTQNISWSDELENILKSLAEKSLCYSWLHDQSEKKFNKLYQRLSLPVIILSTVSGSASIGISNFGNSELASVIIGIVSIGTGILQTINSFFGYSKRAESHKIASITYKKLHRFISIELSLQREQRLNPKHFLKMVRETTDRLLEIQPGLDEDIIIKFKEKFKNIGDGVSIPEETNGIDALNVNRKITKKQNFIDIIKNFEYKNESILSPISIEKPINFSDDKITLEIEKN